MAADRGRMIDPSIFEGLQTKIDEESSIRDDIRDILQTLEKQERSAAAILSRAHSTPPEQLTEVINSAEAAIKHEIESIARLAAATEGKPYYKFNHMWTRQVQDACFTIIFCGWLGGFGPESADHKQGGLLTIEQVGQLLNVPVNLKDRDAFHLTIEEYLHALISLIEELSRLARNSVTLGDYRRPLRISQFIKDLHAGFQILNLKNDSLRKRSDGIKYRVKEVEDVVYDLSLRNLIPRTDE